MQINRDYRLVIQCGSMSLMCEKGSPVLLSVPHDGLPFNSLSGLYEPRKIGYRGRDLNVWPIAKDILYYTTANAIRGLMPRTLVDYNRAWPVGINYYPLTQKEVHTALDDARLLPMYEDYHESINRIIKESCRKFKKDKVLLIDLHGFAKQPPYAPDRGYDLIFGTGNRVSVPHGNVDVLLAKHMEDAGYKVFLPNELACGVVEDWYSADFTTRHHSEKHGINAIQIEIAQKFRVRGALVLGKKLAQDFAGFVNKLIQA